MEIQQVDLVDQGDTIRLLDAEVPNINDDPYRVSAPLSAPEFDAEPDSILPPPGPPSQLAITVRRVKQDDCLSEKIFWKYARCILFLNVWYAAIRVLIYLLVVVFRILTCSLKRTRDALSELLSTFLILFGGGCALLLIDCLHVPSCTGEVLAEFLIGGLALQFTLTLIDALVATMCCRDVKSVWNMRELLNNLLEPVMFIGGIYSFIRYRDKSLDDKKRAHSKYACIGNIVGSVIAVTISVLLCHAIGDGDDKFESKYLISNDDDKSKSRRLTSTTSNYSFFNGSDQLNDFPRFESTWDDFRKPVENARNSTLALNMLARIFADGLAHYMEYRLHKKYGDPMEHELKRDHTVVTVQDPTTGLQRDIIVPGSRPVNVVPISI